MDELRALPVGFAGDSSPGMASCSNMPLTGSNQISSWHYIFSMPLTRTYILDQRVQGADHIPLFEGVAEDTSTETCRLGARQASYGFMLQNGTHCNMRLVNNKEHSQA